jgi:uncharacterized protein
MPPDRDCAFPPAAYRLPPPSESAPDQLWYPHPARQFLTLDAEHVVAFVPSYSQIVVLNRAAQTLLDALPVVDGMLNTTTALHTLVQAGLAVPSPIPELVVPAEPDVLVAWLHITNACNLGCHYCYIQKSAHTMDTATAFAAVDMIMRTARRQQYRHVVLKYAGGEPGLRVDLVAAVHRYACEQANANSVHLTASILTNGTTLTPAAVQMLAELGIRVTISLDGPATTHDHLRPTVEQCGSFAAVEQGIHTALEGGIRPDIAITVTAYNIADLPQLLRWLLGYNLRFSLSLYRNAPQQDAWQVRANDQALIQGLRSAYAVIEECPPTWSVLNTLLDRVDLSVPHQRTCAAGHNYLVIDHHGNIAKCQMQLTQPVATLNTPNPLDYIRAGGNSMQNVPVDHKQGCCSCMWRYWCAGGCAVETFRTTSRYDVPSPNCAIYRTLYPDVIRLEGLRLLHHMR